MEIDSPKAQISGGKPHCFSQRVEDNAVHLVTRGLTGVNSLMKSRCGKRQNVTGQAFLTLPQMLSRAPERCGGQSNINGQL
jgi:hypothetical protein